MCVFIEKLQYFGYVYDVKISQQYCVFNINLNVLIEQ